MNKPLKIAICGSHGVGKTTLAKRLADEFNLPFIEEVARTVADQMGFKSTEEIASAAHDVKQSFQLAVFVNQFFEEQKQKNGFISDRSLVDVVAYAEYYGLNWADQGQYALFYASNNYDLLIYCPIPDTDITDDGFRLTDKASQKAVDRIIKSLTKKTRCLFLELGKNRDDWFKACQETIITLKERKEGRRS